MGPWARKWGDFLARLRALSGHHPHRPAFFTSKAHLAAAFLELVQKPGCTCKTIRWNSWRRFGAAPLQALRLPLHLVQIWGGGWKSDVHYAPPPPPNWTFVKGACQGPSGTTTSRGGMRSPAHPRPSWRVGPHRIASAPPPPHFLSVYFFSVPFCPCLPGPRGLDKLPPTSPACPLTA